MINVYDSNPNDQQDDPKIIGRVKYNDRLDVWNGNNYQNGGTGMHKGITRLTKSGRMVIIIGTQWQGCRDYAYTVTDDEAIQECLTANCPEIIDEYPQLAKIYKNLESD
jgi:hypothetical protein